MLGAAPPEQGPRWPFRDAARTGLAAVWAWCMGYIFFWRGARGIAGGVSSQTAQELVAALAAARTELEVVVATEDSAAQFSARQNEPTTGGFWGYLWHVVSRKPRPSRASRGALARPSTPLPPLLFFVTHTFANSYTHNIHESLIVTPPTPYNHTSVLGNGSGLRTLGSCPLHKSSMASRHDGNTKEQGAKQEIHFI